MNCPVCRTSELRVSERQGIEIDFCPQCRGVWLDRGELDKLIERSAAYRPDPRDWDDEPSYEKPKRSEYGDSEDRRYSGEGKKKKGFFGDIFDIFD